MTTTCCRPKLAFTAAVMDLMHEGHIRMLERMNEKADLVAVILHNGFSTFANKRKFPVESLEKRVRNLIDSGLVDIIRITYEKEPLFEIDRMIKKYSAKFELLYVRGNDWKDFPGRPLVEQSGIPIVFVPYTKSVSSSKLRSQMTGDRRR